MFIKFEENIIGMKGFSKLWINGTASAKKDSLEKHIKGDLHLLLPTLRKKKQKLGADTYNIVVVSSSPTGRSKNG